MWRKDAINSSIQSWATVALGENMHGYDGKVAGSNPGQADNI